MSRGRRLHAGAPGDLWIGIGVALGVLSLYLATLQPDFGGPEDTPKFQFLGYVLGTAHPPGYPLYVLLSHFFVALPVGTIAFRANLFSAVVAALGCALGYAIARRLGSSRWSSACAALGLGSGASYWRNAVLAEVYSLAAVMVALTILALLAWSARGGVARLLAAVAAFGLGLGNHLTIVGLLPAAVVFGVSRDRSVLRPRILIAAAAILLVCVSQYGFIILRTEQQAAYLESRARTLPELTSVVTAQRFADQRFAFGPRTLLAVQLPAALSAIGAELGILGVALLGVGIVDLLRCRNAGGGLVLGAAAGILAMVVNLSGDFKGFITPIAVCVWPLAALGADRVRRWRGSGLLQPAAAGAALILLAPVANVRANYADVDRSGYSEDGRFFRRFFAQLPDRAAVVAEDYFSDMALHYYMFTNEGGPDRGIVAIPFSDGVVREAARAGHRVYAFGRAASVLAAHGLSFERVEIVGPPLDTWLQGLPRGTIVAGAAAFSAVPHALSDTDRKAGRSGLRAQPFTVFALSAPDGAREARQADEPLSLSIDGPMFKGASQLPGTVAAFADERGARVRVANRTVAQSPRGLALAAFTPDGALARTLEFRSEGPFRVAPETAVYELKGTAPCVDVSADGWKDVTAAFATGSWVATLRDLGSVTIDLELPAAAAANARVAELMNGGEARVVGRTTADREQIDLAVALSRPREGRPLFRMAVNRAAAPARARLRPDASTRTVTLCGHRPAAPLLVDAAYGALKADFESEAYFGSGWGDSERTPTGRVRRATGPATLLLPLTSGRSYRFSLDLAGAPGRIDLLFNDTSLGSCEPGGRNESCDVQLPSALVRDGVNALTLRAAPSPASDGPWLTFQGARIAPIE